MAQPAPVLEAPADRIRRAAVQMFSERGYRGTSVRALAHALRIEAASLYYHFPSKQHILLDVLGATITDLHDGLRQAIGRARGPREQLRAAVRFHVLFHTERRDEAFVAGSELRSLSPAHRRAFVARRDAYERMFRDLLQRGAAAGVFTVEDVKLTAMAILTMATGVAAWFSERGRLTPGAVADRYADLALRMVGA
jgi:AcrR family transcriptional regulator